MTERDEPVSFDDEDLAELEDVIIDLRSVAVHPASEDVVVLHISRMIAAAPRP